MANSATRAAIEDARKQQFADDEIVSILAETNPEVAKAVEAGFEPKEVIDELYALTSASQAGPYRGEYQREPVKLSDYGPYRLPFGYTDAAPPAEAPATPARISAPRPENAPRSLADAMDRERRGFNSKNPFSEPTEGSFSESFNDRTRELFADPIARGYNQTAQASNVFTGGTAVESLESAAHDIAERERQARSAPKADYMVAAEEQVKQIVENVMTPDQIQRQYERRQYLDDLENGVNPKPFIPHPGYPGEAEQQQAEADLASAFGGDVQVQKPEYNLPGDPFGMPPVIALTDGQKAEAIARMSGVYLKDPRRAINVSLESLTASATGLGLGFGLGAAGGSVAGVPGAVIGGAGGMGIGSFLAEYGGDVLDQMRQDGIDLTNEQVVLRLLTNPEYMERVKDHARRRGAGVATFDALSGAIGGRLGGPVTRALEDVGKVSSKVGKQVAKISGEGAEILAQGLTGGAGEIAGARYAGDQVDPEAVTQEIIGEAGSGGVEVLSGRYNDQRAEEAYRASPEGRADATRERALSSALDLTARIRASSPPAATMPAPALTGSRASDAAGGTGTAPIPPAAQGTAQTLQEQLTPGSVFRAPDGDYGVVAASPNPDPDKFFLGLRGPDGELQPWTLSEFAAHLARQNEPPRQKESERKGMVQDLREKSAGLRDKEPERKEMVQGLRQMSDAMRDPEPAKKEKEREAMVLNLRQASADLRSPEPGRKKMVQGLRQKSDALRSRSVEQIENEKTAAQYERQADTLDKAGTPGWRSEAQELRQKARALRGQEQPSTPVAPAKLEPASTPAPASKAASTTQESAADVEAPPAPKPREPAKSPLERFQAPLPPPPPSRMVGTSPSRALAAQVAEDTKAIQKARDEYLKATESAHGPKAPDYLRRHFMPPELGVKDIEQARTYRQYADAIRAHRTALEDAVKSVNAPLTVPEPAKAPKADEPKRAKVEEDRAAIEQGWGELQQLRHQWAAARPYPADHAELVIKGDIADIAAADDYNKYAKRVAKLRRTVEKAVKTAREQLKPHMGAAPAPTGTQLSHGAQQIEDILGQDESIGETAQARLRDALDDQRRDMESGDENPREIAEEFWENTYDKLGPLAQKHTEEVVQRGISREPKSFPTSTYHLDTFSRPTTAWMRWANEMLHEPKQLPPRRELDEDSVYPLTEGSSRMHFGDPQRLTGEPAGKSEAGVTQMPTTPDKFEEIIDEVPALFEAPVRTVVPSKEPGYGPMLSKEEAATRIESWQAAATAQSKIPHHKDGNSNRVIYSLFDWTGQWAQPFKDAGYDVRYFDIKDGADVREFSVEWFMDNIPDITDVYGFLIACPCTDFTVSGSQWWRRKDMDGRTEASKELVYKALQVVEYFKPQGFWALENPVKSRIGPLTGLPRPRLIFQPNDYGNPYTKETSLWGNFNPHLPTAPVEPTEGSKMHSQYGGRSERTKEARSETPEGFAAAFFMANNYLGATSERRLLGEYPLAAGAIEKALAAGFSEKQIVELIGGRHDILDDEGTAARAALRKLVKEGTPEPKETPEPQPAPKPAKKPAPVAQAAKPAAEPQQPETKEKEGIFTGAHPILTDRREEVITPNGTKVETTFEVVEAADLISSDNSKFPKQLQPRKRERKTSEDQIRDIVAKFDPAQLGASRLASHGAPIIGMDDNYVESGNGRVMAIRKVYADHPELAKRYRQLVRAISGVDISKMKEPVLVRRRQTVMSDEERVKWTREANKDVLMQMSAAEKAAVDQEKLTPSVMSELPDNMDEPIKLVEGKGLEFVQKFVAQFTPAERGELIDADGNVSSIALNRAKAALLQKAYGGTPAGDAAIRRAAESTDTDAQTLVNTLMHFAPPFAQLKDEIAAGRVQEQADIGPQIAAAVEVVRAAGSPGAVTRWLNTEDLLEPKDATVKQLIQTFYTFDGRGDAKRLRSAAAIGSTLSGYLKTARQHTPAGASGGLFGDDQAAVLNPAAELVKLNAGRKEQEQQSERQDKAQRSGQGGLFTAGGKPSAPASTGTGDESGGEKARSTGLGESRDSGDAEASAASDEEVTELDDDIGATAAEDDYEDDSGVESAMDDTDEAQADEEVEEDEDSGIEEGRHDRAGERVTLPSTTRENLMRYLGIDPAEFRVMGGKQQWATAVKAIKQRFGFADIIKHKAQNWRNAVDHLLDAFESLDNLAEVLKSGSRIASLGGRITLHMREKPGKTKGYFRYKPDGAEPGNTIALYNQEDVYSHELAHGIDYDMMERAGGAGPGGLTKMIRERQNTGKLPNNLLEAMADVYNAMYYDDGAIAGLIAKTQHQLSQAKTPSEKAKFQKRLTALQNGTWRGNTAYSALYKRAMNGPMKRYLTKPTEFFARVFEAYVSHKIQGQQAMGLVKFLGATDAIYSDQADAWIKRVYPHGAERQAIFATLDNLVGQIARDDIYNVGTQSPGLQQSHINLGLIDPVAQAKANGTPITPDIIRAHNLTNKAAMTFLEDELARNESTWKNLVQLMEDLTKGRPGAAQSLNAAMSKLASTPDTVMQFLEMRFPHITVLRTIRNQLSDAHIAGRNKPMGIYREWQRTEHSITNDLQDRMRAVGVLPNMPKADAEHFWDVAHGLAKPKNAAVKRQVDQFIYELARLWKLRDKTGENIGYVDEAYVNRVFLKDVADNPKFHADLLRLRVQEKNDLIVQLQSQRLAATDPAEIARLKAAIKRAQARDPVADTRSQVAKMKGLSWGEPVYLGAMNEDSAKERVFSAAADEILKEWYVKDPATLLQMYGSAAARGITMRRRFGDKPEEVFQGWLDKVALELPAAYGELLKNAMEVSMGFRKGGHGSLTRAINGAANVTTANMLGRSVFPNISELLNIFGKGVSVPVTFGALMKATVPFIRSASVKKRFATADRFGRLSGALVDAASSSTAMAQHIGEDTLGNGILARFSVRAYYFNALSGLTALQQKATNRIGFEEFYHVAAQIRKGGPGAELYRQWFREHGISDPDGMAKFLENIDNIDDIDLTDTLFPGAALTLSNAITQFIHTTIQHPTPSTKHIQANRGVIGLIFRLTSWMTTNFINITRFMKNRAASAISGKYGGEEIHLRHRLSGERAGKQLTAHERVFGRTGGKSITVGQRVTAMAAPAATLAVTMYAAQAAFVIARMMLTNKDEWEDRGDEFWDRFTNRKTQLQIFQYWGIMGWGMNTAVDAVEGTRYNRGVMGSLAGPAYGGWEQDAERLMMGAVSLADQARGEKEISVAVKNNAAQAAYHLVSNIISVGLLNVLKTRGMVGPSIGFAWSMFGTSPWARHKFADAVAGKKTKDLQAESKAGDMDATNELNQRAAEKAANPLALDFLDPNQ